MAWHDQDVRCTERKVLGMLEPYSKQDNEGFSSAGTVSGSLKLVSVLSAIVRKKVLVSCRGTLLLKFEQDEQRL